MSTDLLFGPKATGGSTANLVFGADDTPVAENRVLTIAGRIPALRGAARVRLGRAVEARGTMPALAGRITTRYDSNTERPIVCDLTAEFQVGAPCCGAAQERFQQSLSLSVGGRGRFSAAQPRGASTTSCWQSAQRARKDTTSAFHDAKRIGFPVSRARFQNGVRVRAAVRSAFEDAIRIPLSPVRGHFQEAFRDRRNFTAARFQLARPYLGNWRESGGPGSPVWRGGASRYQDARRPPIGQWSGWVIPPAEPCYKPAVPMDLVFSGAWSADTGLVFVCEKLVPPEPSGTVVIPILRSYIVLNDVALRRVSDSKEFEPTALSLSIDHQSYVWGFSASLPGSAFADMAPTGSELVELEASINGYAWRVLVESRKRDREFGKRSLSISGRGLAMMLSDTKSPELTLTNTESRTAQQLAAEALAPRGVDLGWELDWRVDDWIVPAGCWSYQGAPIGAINRIAEAAGAYVQADAALKKLFVLPKYPAAPWAWAGKSPDVILPIDICETDSVEEMDAAEYNGVYVSGTTAGPLARVYRSGTAGDVLAQMVTDALITDPAAARMRGISVLGTSGRKRMITRSLPIMAPAGLIGVGKFVRVDSEAESSFGIVRGASISASDKSVVRQSLGIECNA